MTTKKIFLVSLSLLVLSVLYCCEPKSNNGIINRIEQLEKDGKLVVQIAELVIDATQLEAYTQLLQEGIRTSVQKEPGVLSLYAMADQDQPTRITVVEIYADQAAYEAHISAPHFLKYKNGTSNMVQSLTLTRTRPVVFSAKGN